MIQEVTEQEATQSLEDVLSPEQEEVSENEEVKEPEAKEEPIQFTPEQETEIQKRIQSEKDKEFNPYREKRESDTALIRSLSAQVKELEGTKVKRDGNKRIERVLAGEEEAGISPDVTRERESALKEFNNLYKEYKENSAAVEDAAKTIGDMAEKLPANIVREFGLDDPNPSVRAVNGVKFLDETATVFKYSKDFLMVVEDFLPKGDELRKQIEEIVEGLSEFNDEKSKKLYLKDRLRGVKITPRKKPQTPSDTTGGGKVLRGAAALAEGLKEERQKLKIS